MVGVGALPPGCGPKGVATREWDFVFVLVTIQSVPSVDVWFERGDGLLQYPTRCTWKC